MMPQCLVGASDICAKLGANNGTKDRENWVSTYIRRIRPWGFEIESGDRHASGTVTTHFFMSIHRKALPMVWDSS